MAARHSAYLRCLSLVLLAFFGIYYFLFPDLPGEAFDSQLPTAASRPQQLPSPEQSSQLPIVASQPQQLPSHAQSSQLPSAASQPQQLPSPEPAWQAVHFIYTTACDDYQLIHSVVLDYNWLHAKNTGRLTRIVSGCRSAAEKTTLARSPLSSSQGFAVFFAEGVLDHIPSTGERYPARARPHSISQWLAASFPAERVIALLDPDFVFLRPLSQHPSLALVKQGRMVSSSGWEAGVWPGSGYKVKPEYATGPIWLLHALDLETLLDDWANWTDYWPKVTGLLREQFSLQASAEKNHVPATFVSDLTTHMMQSGMARADGTFDVYSLHYFLSYNFKAWGFHKSLASSGWYADSFSNVLPTPLECGAPLLQEPPKPTAAPETQTLAVLIPRMNLAFRAFREAQCPGEASAFASRGLGAFGLVRTMHPLVCSALGKRLTRYRVKAEQPASWEAEQALNGTWCSHAAQAMVPALQL